MAYVAHARLRHADTPGRAGLRARELAALVDGVDALPGQGWCGGAVVLAGRGPYIAVEHATGWALRYTSRDVELPEDERVPVTAGTRFDLASLTKL